MELIIELSEIYIEGYYKAIEKGGKMHTFYGRSIKECIARSREYARILKKERLKLIDNNGNEIYKVKFQWRDEKAFRNK